MYVINYMQDYLAPVKLPLNLWDKNSIRPGPVGSVGDALVQVRLKQSAPELEPRYEVWNSDEMNKFHGSNVQDGRKSNYMTGGMNAKTFKSHMPYRPGYKTQQGWVHQDIVPVDRDRETLHAALPKYGWKSKVASVVRAKVSGQSFLPRPRGYTAVGSPRGGLVPRVVAKSVYSDPLPSTSQIIKGPISGLSREAVAPPDDQKTDGQIKMSEEQELWNRFKELLKK